MCRLASLSLGEEKFRAKALTPVGADDGGIYRRCFFPHFSPWRYHRGTLLSLLMSMAWVLRVKMQASTSRSRRKSCHRHFPLVDVALESHLLAVVCWFLLRWGWRTPGL
jgi:hypothetical protein